VRLCAIVLFVPVFLIEAQTGPADCSHRTAEDFVAMTRQDRAADYIRGLAWPQAYLYAGTLAGVDQAANRPREWGQGALNYGSRFGNYFALNAAGTTLQDALALGLDEDNRYFHSGRHGFGRRLGYAAISPFLARRSDGSRSISISALGGSAGASLVGQVWQPSPGQMGTAARSFGLTFAFRMGLDIVREFAPRAVTDVLR
jgi:hypothetical protein